MSEQSKHTPGPWKVCHPIQNGPGFDWHLQASPWVEDANGQNVTRQHVEHPGMLDEKRLANARLIAASPCLLEFAKKLLEDEPGSCQPMMEMQVRPEHYHALRAAIARAEGA